MRLGRWQPDIFCISLRGPLSGDSVLWPADHGPPGICRLWNQSRDPSANGWRLGARGMVRTELLTPALEFLEIPKQKWVGIIAATVRASVEELAHMNRICFSTSSQNSIFDSDDPKLSYASRENLLSVGSKCKIQKDSNDLRARQIRWRRINGDRGLQHGSPDNGDRRQPPSSTWCQHCLDVVFAGKPFVFLS